MDWSLFSFYGRFNRAKFWLVALFLAAFFMVVGILIVETTFGQHAPTAVSGGIVLVLVVAYLVSLWISLATGTKRLHDRNKSGWWVLLFYFVPSLLQILAAPMARGQNSGAAGVLYLVAIGISLWAFVELGCLRGTIGENRYGHDPLGTDVAHAFD
jgi:uncharacterized membrane protein YhaH (DUF805 family)